MVNITAEYPDEGKDNSREDCETVKQKPDRSRQISHNFAD